MLPTTRDINAVVLKAPGVHPSGPNGSYSIAGSMSFESLYLVNGVNVNENLRGQANNLYIEDAVQETMVATDGISAEYGRFSGGVVNVITKSGGNRFSGSFRDSLYNDDWRAKVTGNDDHPFTDRHDKVDSVISQYEYVLGGPIQRDRLWFFNAGRIPQRPGRPQHGRAAELPYTFEDKSQRYEGKLTYSLNRQSPLRRRLYEGEPEGSERHVQHGDVDGPAQPLHARAAAESLHRRLQRRHLPVVLRRRPLLAAPLQLHRLRRARRPTSSTARCSSTAPAATCATGRRRSAASATRRSATTRKCSSRATYVLSTRSGGSHTLLFGYDTFNDQRFANNHQSGSDYRILGTSSIIRGADIYPALAAGIDDDSVEPDRRRQPGHELPHQCDLLQRQLALDRSRDRSTSACAGTRTRARTAPGARVADDSALQPACWASCGIRPARACGR